MLTITYPENTEQADHGNGLSQLSNAYPRRRRVRPTLLAALLLCVWTIFVAARMPAQSANESLGPKDSVTHDATIPLQSEMKTLRSSLLPDLVNVHPRVYFTQKELDTLRAHAHGEDKAWWQERLLHLRALQGPPPPPPAETRRAQNDVAFAIAEAAFAYKMEGDPNYLAAAKRYMDAAVSYDVWGYSFSKPNVDLAAGHLLYGMGVGYDLLYNDLTPVEREKVPQQDCTPGTSPLCLFRSATRPQLGLQPEPHLHPDVGSRRRRLCGLWRGSRGEGVGCTSSSNLQQSARHLLSGRLLLRRLRVLDICDPVDHSLP